MTFAKLLPAVAHYRGVVMGKRDYRWKESRKPKKDAKKTTTVVNILPTPVTVEVIKKGKKEPPVEE